jgi:pyruvate formate lyase activating enzyme
MEFKGWLKTSLIEYPDHVASVLFTAGCNFRCPFCYNPDLVLDPDRGEAIPAKTVLDYLVENRSLYEAVVVSGGEPTLHPELPEFFAACKQAGLLTGLETNGTSPRLLARLIREGLLDYAAMDVKAPLSFSSYRQAAGLPDNAAGRDLFQHVRESIDLLLKCKLKVEFRTTLVAELHNEEDVELMAAALTGADRYLLQQFKPGPTVDKAYSEARPWQPERLRRLIDRLSPRFPACGIRE